MQFSIFDNFSENFDLFNFLQISQIFRENLVRNLEI